jgi:hypothetical protein
MLANQPFDGLLDVIDWHVGGAWGWLHATNISGLAQTYLTYNKSFAVQFYAVPYRIRWDS